ncbi:hypothetical protein KGY79_11635 [Candidatus Bipolaricaulota bacterium]|nr:hypothetical protein [Candidatus Bipolaricaulota bacterium]
MYSTSIYDAKSRKEGYSINTAEERKFEDYMHQWVPKLKGQGFRNVYFAVISGNFNDESKDTLKSLKIRTDIQEIVLVEAGALTELLEQFLRDPELNLGPGNREGAGIQDLFAESRVLKASDVREELGI